jgi:hypothetical protein
MTDLTLLAIAQELRDRAKEALARAETFPDPQAKRLMRQIAAINEDLAQRLEREAGRLSRAQSCYNVAMAWSARQGAPRCRLCGAR